MSSINNNLNRFAVTGSDNTNPVKKAGTENTTTAVKNTDTTSATPSDKRDLSTSAKNVKDTSGSFSFVDEQTTETNTPTSFSQIDSDINAKLKDLSAKVPPEKSKEFFEKYAQVKNYVLTNNLKSSEDVNKFNGLVKSLMLDLKSQNLFDDKMSKDFQSLVTTGIEKVGKNNGINLKPEVFNGNILGIRGSNNNSEVSKATQKLALETEALRTSKTGKFTQGDLLVMGMRDELLRKSFELLHTTKDDDRMLQPVYKDMGIISNAVASMDQMLKGTNDLPPNMLKDMNSMVDQIAKAPKGMLDKQLTNFANDPLSTVNDKLKNPPKLPSMPTDLKDKLSNNNLPDSSKIVQAQNALMSLVKATPQGVSPQVKNVIDAYTTAMNGVEKALPPVLPWPVTLSTPLNYNDGTTNISIPVGSTLSQNKSGFLINSPSLLFSSKDTSVLAGNSQIQLGNGTDYLSMGNLQVDNGSTHTDITNAKAQIDRTTGTSFIKADQANINTATGKVELTNAGLYQDKDGNMKLSADKFISNSNDKNLSFENFNLSETKNSTSLSANKINFNDANNSITADKFTMDMNHTDTADTTTIVGENINVITKDANIKAASANVNLTSNKDGSSSTILNTKDTSVALKNGKIDALGNSTIALNQDKNGNLTNINVKSEQLNFKDDKNAINVNNGNLNVNYGDNGKIKDISANAGDFAFKDNKGQSITAKNTDLALAYGDNGYLNSVKGKTDQLNYTGNKGSLDVGKGNLDVAFFDNGNPKAINADSQSVLWKGVNGENISAQNTKLTAGFYDNGNINNLSGSVDKLNYLNKQGDNLNVTKGSTNVNFDKDGNLTQAMAKAEKVNYQGKNGDSLNADNVELNAIGGKNGLEKLDVKVGSANYLNSKGENLNLTGGTATINRSPDGYISNIEGKADKLNYQSLTGDKVDVTGLEVKINGDKNGITSAGAKAGEINYLNAKGDNLNVKDGALNITKDNEGYIKQINGSAKDVVWKSATGDTAQAKGLDIQINASKNGIENANVKVGELNYLTSKGDNIKVTEGAVSVFKDKDGLLTGATGSAKNISLTNKDGLTANGSGINLNLTVDKNNNYNINASADKLNLKDPAKNIEANAQGFTASLDSKQIKFHVDSAELIKKVENDLNVKVENLDLVLDKTTDGNSLKGADLQLSSLDGKVKGMDVMVRTQNGDRVRLNMSMSDDGKMLKEAFLQIPKGGEVKIQKDDMKVTLGEQLIKFSNNGNGLYTLRDDGLNIDAVTKNSKIHVQGGSAQVSIDTKSGNLIIDDIHGTKINAEFGKNKVDIDIKEMKGFIVKTTGLSGPVEGAMLELKPTSDGSKMTMSVRANVSGIPVRVDLKDVHELKAMASIGHNEAHVYFGDSSGRGQVKLGVGPVEMKGSAIEFLAKYHTYDSERMLSSVSRYMSNDGLQLGPLTLEPDGVIRLEKQSSGLHLGAAVLVPRVWEENLLPNEFIGNRPKDGSWGAILSVGGQGEDGNGTKYVGNLYAGLVPGSYLSIDQKQGTTSIYNIPLPSNITIPTTAMAGIGFRRESDTSKLTATVGGYVNPLGLAPANSPFNDTAKYGAFTSVTYKERDYQFSLEGIAGVARDPQQENKDKIDYGVRAGFSMSF